MVSMQSLVGHHVRFSYWVNPPSGRTEEIRGVVTGVAVNGSLIVQSNPDAPKEYHLDVSTEYEVNRIPGGYVEVQAWQKLRLFDERDIVTLNKVEGT
jgi:hypothetical protein